MIKTNSEMAAIKVCAAVVYHHNKILITLRPEDKKLGGYWEFPGGKVEKQETPEEALKREMMEELAIEVEIGELLETVHHRYDWGNVIILAYWCQWTSGEIKHLEVADHCWVDVKDLTAYNILAADQPIIKKIQEQRP